MPVVYQNAMAHVKCDYHDNVYYLWSRAIYTYCDSGALRINSTREDLLSRLEKFRIFTRSSMDRSDNTAVSENQHCAKTSFFYEDHNLAHHPTISHLLDWYFSDTIQQHLSFVPLALNNVYAKYSSRSGMPVPHPAVMRSNIKHRGDNFGIRNLYVPIREILSEEIKLFRFLLNVTPFTIIDTIDCKTHECNVTLILELVNAIRKNKLMTALQSITHIKIFILDNQSLMLQLLILPYYSLTQLHLVFFGNQNYTYRPNFGRRQHCNYRMWFNMFPDSKYFLDELVRIAPFGTKTNSLVLLCEMQERDYIVSTEVKVTFNRVKVIFGDQMNPSL